MLAETLLSKLQSNRCR